ncbi:hypothetical protein NFX46_00560 [Streptomyces phaeoluteigriseus]|uniref:Uncharacterized protein n=1 Tax=Streptomyces phaeoluteigriseus TaxID=114686 RepID=A0ABY4Z230_9ACTN|nr:hypothetical protein [Streptomyces phaeoluteigriseus]USQ82392.1 hypothetical protein NFX46_00560 [Streptomyces phaeoluteigriseus]
MPGTVLLLAASPVGKGCLVDAASVLPVLAAVPPAVLAGTDTANVVELADPLEPQAVLTRLRAAAAAPGPLTVFVTGQLQLDRKQRLPHLALARTTPSTVRYTGFPWHWFREELRLRAAGTTTLLLDLHADAETWAWLRGRGLECGPGVAVYGRVAPPVGRRKVAAPTYMKAVATVLRSGGRPGLDQLHQLALARIAGEGEVGDLVLWGGGAGVGAGGGPGVGFAPAAPSHPVSGVPAHSPPVRPERPRPQAPDGLEDDPHARITAAVQAGDHPGADALAARWEQVALLAHGAGSEEVLHWSEVRADLAMFAGDAERSCRTWMAVAAARLAAGQPADAAPVEAAVDRAHHQWGRITDRDRARDLGPALADLRGRVPGRREGALDHVREQLRQLQTQS